jgi:hypothetical protein
LTHLLIAGCSNEEAEDSDLSKENVDNTPLRERDIVKDKVKLQLQSKDTVKFDPPLPMNVRKVRK